MNRRTVTDPLVEQLGQLSGVRAAVRDRKDVRVMRKIVSECRVGRRIEACGPSHLDASQPLERAQIGWSNFTHRVEAERAKRIATEGRLGGCRDHEARTVAPHQVAQGLESGLEQARRHGLRFVEHDDAPGQVVELAAARRPSCEQALEKLNRRGHDDRHIPVLRGKARARGLP
jgi:hypothetical protein